MRVAAMILALLALTLGPAASLAQAPKPKTMPEILAASSPGDWRGLDLDNTLIMRLPHGRTVIMELAPIFAPNTVENIKTLARAGYFDGLSINRVQDNFVAQWGDPDADDAAKRRPLGQAHTTILPEFTRALDRSLPLTLLRDRDGFARRVGHVNGMPAASDGRAIWPAHCYGALGVGRDNASDSGSGAELYAVIGHAPRQLDRNITVVGRVVSGIEHLAALPRGTGALGFYEKAEQRTPILSVVIASSLPNGGAAGNLERLRTDTATFRALVEARRNRRDEWYKVPAGYIDVCNVPLPVRAKQQ
jgi:peptidylprolyl isomerase